MTSNDFGTPKEVILCGGNNVFCAGGFQGRGMPGEGGPSAHLG